MSPHRLPRTLVRWSLALGLLLSGPALAPLGAQQGGGYAHGGLQGAYYNTGTLPAEGTTATFTRSDVRIAFDWGTTRPVGGSNAEPYRSFPTDNFSVRWTGQVIARFGENYTFKTEADDGVRLFIRPAGGSTWTTLIDQWNAAGTYSSAPQALGAGLTYDLKLEYREATGSAKVVLKWSGASTPEEIIEPAAQISINWNTYDEQTFADAFKNGRSNWEGTGGAAAPAMDASGWPLGDCSFIVSEWLVPNDISPMETGWMRLTFQGRATLSTFGQCRLADVNGDGQRNASDYSWDSGSNTTTAWIEGFDNNVNVAQVHFQNTDRDGDFGGDSLADKDGITNVRLMRPTAPGATTALENSMLLHPKFREAFDRFTQLRFQRVNDQTRTWAERISPTYAFSSKRLPYVYNSRYNGGAWNLTGSTTLSHEREIQIVNELGCDYYVTVPHLATTGDAASYMRKLANLIRHGSDASGEPYTTATANPAHPPLNPNLYVYVEISNELWNFAALSSYAPYFDYRELMEDKADANDAEFLILNFDNLPKTLDSGGYYTNNWTWVRRYWGLKLKQISDDFRAVWGDSEMPGGTNRQPRVRPYFTWQYANANDTAKAGLEFMNNYYNNAAGSFVATPRPVSYYFWCGGGAGYYSSSNKDGFVDPNPVLNPGFETPVVSGLSLRPTGGSWVFSNHSGLVSATVRNPAITAATPGATLTNRDDYVGCKITVGASPVTVYELGRWVFSGNTKSHDLKLVRASDLNEVASVAVNTSGAPAGAFAYARCIPVQLDANTAYYLLSKEASASDTFGDATGSLTPVAGLTVNLPATGTVANNVWTVVEGSGAGKSWGPVSLKVAAVPTSNGTPVNPPDPMQGTQMAWLQNYNGTAAVAEITFPLPATQTDNHYALSFRWTQRTKSDKDAPDAARFKVFATSGGNTVEITPRDANTQPAQWSTSNEWKRVNYWVGNYYYTETFTGAAGANVTIRFEGDNGAGTYDHLAFLDDFLLTSADAFYAGDIPSTGAATGQTAGTYLGNQIGDGQWCAAYGLVQMTYEHGFSAGGDSGNSAIQNYCKFGDPRGRQTVVDCLDIFQRSGGSIPTFGTYSTWPAHEPISGVRVEGLLDATAYPLTQGMDDILAQLPEAPTNGRAIPATIPGGNYTLASGGAALATNGWATYDLVVTTPRQYAVGVETTSGGTVELSLGNTTPIASGASGTIRSGTLFLPFGHHALRVRNSSGNFTISNVLIDAASQAPAAPLGLTAGVNPTTLAVSLSWSDASGGSSQEMWFEIQRATDSSFTQNVANFQVAADTTGWTDPTQLAVATTYYYRVRAFNLAAPSAWTALASGVLIDVPPPSHLLYHQDDFGASARALHGTATGSGWSGAWAVQNSDAVLPGFEVRTASPLSYTGLTTSGSAYAMGGRAYLSSGRTLALAGWPYFFKKTVSSTTHLGADGTTVWVSALARVDKANTSGAFLTVSQGTNAAVSNDHKAGTVISNGKWALRVKNSANAWVTTESAVTATVGQTYLLVLKFAFGATDQVSLYVNPTGLGGTEPATPSATASVGLDAYWQALVFNPDESAEQGSLDDVRVGDSFAAVTPAPTAAAPSFNPAPGTFAAPVAVTITTGTPGASIRYTTDGSTPTAGTGTLYTGPVTISATATLRAVAYASGMGDSPVTSGLYTIDLVPTVTTTSLPAGIVGTAYSTTLAATGGDGALSWTLPAGSLPAGLTLSGAGVISGTPSAAGTANFTVRVTDADGDSDDQPLDLTVQAVVANPSFSPAAGTYTGAQSVAITTATSGASIRYTTDGSTPSSTVGTLYTAPIGVASDATLKAIAYQGGSIDSAVVTAAYVIRYAPVITAQPQPVTVAVGGTAVFSVTATGTPAPTYQWRKNGTNLTGATGTSLTLTNVQAADAGSYDVVVTNAAGSATSTAAALTVQETVATPVFSPAGGSYASAQSVTITCATAGSTIRYTTDGSTPSASHGTVYSAPVAVGASLTLKAIGLKTGATDSAVATASYVIGANGPLAYDAFDYTADSLLYGLSGGYGWNGTWTVEGDATSTGYKIVSGSLAYGTLVTAGQRLEGGFSYRTCGRALDLNGVFAAWKNPANYLGKDGTELWISYLGQVAATGNSGKFSLDYGGAVFHDNNGVVRIKNVGGTWQLSLLNDTVTQSTGVAVTTGPCLFVLRLRFDATDTVDLWINPALDAAPPATPQATLTTTSATFQFNEITWYPASAPVAGWFDEVRVGANWGSVTPADLVPTVLTTSLPNATIGTTYTANLQASGGDGALAWSVSAGSLPAGLGLSGSGLLSGTPTGPAGTGNFTARVADTDGDWDDQALSLLVQARVAAPTFSPVGGTYAGGQTVTLATATAGAAIRYTTDGSTPTSTTGTLYSAPVSVSVTTTLKAMAYLVGMTDSTVSTADYVITESWTAQDIGTVTPAGSTTWVSATDTFTVRGAGADIWGTADAFHFAASDANLSGDGSITARVVSVQNTNGWAKAGVMIRETTAANSRHAFACVTPSNGVAFQRRTTTGGTSANNNVTGLVAPYWVRLVRTGNTFQAFRSPDGVTWTQVGSNVTIAMASSAKVGLAVTSHANGTLCTAVIDNVTVVE